MTSFNEALFHAGMNTAPRTLSYNPAENAALMTFDGDGGSYELHILPRDPGRGDTFSVGLPTIS